MEFHKITRLLLFLLAVNTGLIVHGQETKAIDSTTFDFGGFVKLDVMSSWYNNGDVAGDSPMKDFHVPSQIPVGPEDRNYHLDFTAKSSRFNMDVTTRIFGEEIHGFIEMDFLNSVAGDERVTNSFNPRLRHFYFEWEDFLAGQTWSTFMVVILPDDLDLAGAMEGTVLIRQPQLRFKYKSWMFSIENPETTIVANGQDKVLVTDKEVFPDVVVRKNFEGDWGNWSIAGIYRTLNYKDTLDVNHRTPGFGLTTGGKLKMGNRGDDLRMVVTGGSGLGRYLAAGFIAGGTEKADRDLASVPSINGYIAWNHFWKPQKWSSSFNVSAFQAFQDEEYAGPMVNEAAFSASANLKWTPVKQLMFGVEFMHGYRQVLDGTDGSFNRLHFAAKYTFGYTNTSANEKD